ncbi:MAG: hypothetical protein AAFY64_02975, partial [Pseudomonadota bacterium]
WTLRTVVHVCPRFAGAIAPENQMGTFVLPIVISGVQNDCVARIIVGCQSRVTGSGLGKGTHHDTSGI